MHDWSTPSVPSLNSKRLGGRGPGPLFRRYPWFRYGVFRPHKEVQAVFELKGQKAGGMGFLVVSRTCFTGVKRSHCQYRRDMVGLFWS